MNFDIATILVLVIALMSVIWLLERVWWRKRRPAGTKEPYLIDLTRSLLPVFILVLLLRSFVFEPFRIPSGSMMPTLLVGDFILVNKFAYGLRLPVTHSKFWDNQEPQRGDVAVFRFPLDPRIDYIKRIVAVPGDTVDYRDKQLFINGEPQALQIIDEYIGVGSGERETGSLLALEMINGTEHQVLLDPQRFDFGHACRVLVNGPIVIPEGQYFAVGDNRDNSNDSRCWGLVPEANLVGRASYIWMNFDSALPGLPIDWRRLGNRIR
jgi:signal peptidase I